MLRKGNESYKSHLDIRYIEDYIFLMPWRYFFIVTTVTLAILCVLIYSMPGGAIYILSVPSFLLTHSFIKIYWERTDGSVIPRRLPFYEDERGLLFKDIRFGRIVEFLMPYITVNVFIAFPALLIAYVIAHAFVKAI